MANVNLRTNSKQARANIRAYICDNFDGTNYAIETPDSFTEISKIILEEFREEKRVNNEYERRVHSELQSFLEWAAGLPSILDTCYYYNRSAIADLGGILNQTPEKRNNYTEAQAEEALTRLIYRELIEA